MEHAEIARHLNTVAAFLAANDFPDHKITSARLKELVGSPVADLLVLLGNGILFTSEQAFAAMRKGFARRLLIAGGRGHSTELLYDGLKADSRYKTLVIYGRTEAELLAEVATRFHGIDRATITLETWSSNCGENAQFVRRLVGEQGLSAERIILVQDPTMQRRSCASFAKAWEDAGLTVMAANCPTFVPQVRFDGSALVFGDVAGTTLWPMERFISLVLGEIPRLRDDADGYGPQGRRYIAHVNIPDEVLYAHERLASAFPTLMR